MNFKKRGHTTVIVLVLLIFLNITLSEAHIIKTSEPAIKSYNHLELQEENRKILDQEIKYDEIIDKGLHLFDKDRERISLKTDSVFSNRDTSLLTVLERWYNANPMIEFASLIENTITIKFIDGEYTLLMDLFPVSYDYIREDKNPSYLSSHTKTFFPSFTSEQNNGKKALILNQAEYLYGSHHCEKIMKNLQNIGYNVTYISNEEIDLNYTKNNLKAEIVYMNTHAGYWDTDGDKKPDAVVIATGEKWTNETVHIHQFEYNHSMILRGKVGSNYFVAFTPALITYYYHPEDFPDSLIYMATCDAAYDDSMAESFLEAGASVYIGWKQTTAFWTNSITSVLAFKLLSKGFNVNQVCRLIGSGGMYNFLFRSKLIYYGDGYHKIITKKAISSRV